MVLSWCYSSAGDKRKIKRELCTLWRKHHIHSKVCPYNMTINMRYIEAYVKSKHAQRNSNFYFPYKNLLLLKIIKFQVHV